MKNLKSIVLIYSLFACFNLSAQQNSNNPFKDPKVEQVEIELDSNDPDKGWYSLTNEFSAQNITTEISNIKRNTDNKIIAIDIMMKSKDGRIQKLNINRTTPIKSIILFADKRNNPKWDFGIKETDKEIDYSDK